MFKCQVTGKFSRQGRPGPKDQNGEVTHIPGEKLQKIVVERRERVYTKRVRNEETGEWEKVEIGRGWEIVREIDATEEGLALWNSWTPEEQFLFVQDLKARERRAA